MKIKDIVLKLKRHLIIDMYENKINIQDDINSIYTEKLINKYSFKTTISEQSKQTNIINENNKKILNKLNKVNFISFFSLTFLMGLSATFLISFFPNVFTGALWYNFIVSFVFSSFVVSFSFDKITKYFNKKINDNKISLFNIYDRYLNTTYKKEFSVITLELINELDSIKEAELQECVDALKKYLILGAYELDTVENVIDENRHKAIKEKIIKNLFFKTQKIIDNKILYNKNKNILIEEKIESMDTLKMINELKIKHGLI